MTLPPAVYEPDGDAFVPTVLSRGPWDPRAQHGGAPAALLARALEGESDGLSLVRLTYELMRPVPLVPLTIATRVVRPGRRARVLEATLEAGGEPVVRVAGLALRREEGTVPRAPLPGEVLPGPEGAPVSGGPGGERPMFGGDAVELRFVRGAFDEPGPAVAWLRLIKPLIEGEEPSPVQRAAAAADFGNGVSAALDWSTHTFVNADLTIYLLRPPRGEWVGLDSRTAIEPDGAGIAESVLHDTGGPIGSAAQALLVARR